MDRPLTRPLVVALTSLVGAIACTPKTGAQPASPAPPAAAALWEKPTVEVHEWLQQPPMLGLMQERAMPVLSKSTQAVDRAARSHAWLSSRRLRWSNSPAPAGTRRAYYQPDGEDALVMWAHEIDAPPYAARLARLRGTLEKPSATAPALEALP